MQRIFTITLFSLAGVAMVLAAPQAGRAGEAAQANRAERAYRRYYAPLPYYRYYGHGYIYARNFNNGPYAPYPAPRWNERKQKLPIHANAEGPALR